MGHTRLGKIPKSEKWNGVVGLFALLGGEGTHPFDEQIIGKVAALALDAADEGLKKATNDKGLQLTFYALTQLALAGKHKGPERLSELGVEIGDRSSVLSLVSAFQDRLDQEIDREARRTDVSEMAQKAAVAALLASFGEESLPIFSESRESVEESLGLISSRGGFARLGQRFFADFMARFLNFYVSRIAADQTGSKLTPSISSVSEFNHALDRHCIQSAKIVKEFCGAWYSKTEFERGIDEQNAEGFVAVALKKLRAELAQQKEGEYA